MCIILDMSQVAFDDSLLRSAMAAFGLAAQRLDETSAIGGEPRELLELAEVKTMAGLALRKRLTELGWTAPAAQRSTT